MCGMVLDTHLDMVVSSIFTLQNTAIASTPAMAAVNRTPPTKPPTAAPTPVLKQSQAIKLYIHNYVGRIVRSRVSSYSNASAFTESPGGVAGSY